MTIRIALAQVTSTEDATENLATVDRYTSRAAADGARLVVFPEAMMRCFGGASLVEIAQPLDGSWANAVRAIAERADITVVTGMFTPTDDGRVRNTLLVTGAGVDAHYHKIHLFDAFGFAESDTVSPGQDPLVVDIAGVRVGFAICYDLRFPRLFQTMADNGAQLHVISASWGAGPGKVDHWNYSPVPAHSTRRPSSRRVTRHPPLTTTVRPRGCRPQPLAAPDRGVLGSLGAEPDLLTVDLELDTVSPYAGHFRYCESADLSLGSLSLDGVCASDSSAARSSPRVVVRCLPTSLLPRQDPLTGTLLAFSTYAVGYIARPVGGFVFGRLGDIIGRKKLLVITLLLIGVTTFAIGLIPSHASIGIVAPILLVTMRFAQGVAVGGEWGGAVLLSSEYGNPRQRGFWASAAQIGPPAGNLLANGVLAMLTVSMTDGPVRELGLADRIPGICRAGRLRVVDPARTRGHPDLQGLAGVG